MTFLAPLAGIIGAAVCVPVLLLFYFLKLRRRPLRVSSTILWERATQDLQVNTPLRWLRVSWILLLQLAVLALLVMAVARPAIKGSGVGAARVVIIIDRSASMSATDGVPARRSGDPKPVTRLDEAKRRAGELVDSLRGRGGGLGSEDAPGGGGQRRAAVVEFAARAMARTPFTADAAMLKEAVAGVRPTDQPGDLAGALRLLDALGGAAGSGEESAKAERTVVYLFSDGAFADTESLPRARGVEVRHVRVGPAVKPAKEAEADGAAGAGGGAPEISNLGIVAISSRRDYEDPAVVRVFVRVQNSGRKDVETTLELRVNGEVEQMRPVTVPGMQSGEKPGAPPLPAPAAGPGGTPAAEAPRPEPAAAAGGEKKSGDERPGEAAVTLELQNTTGGVVLVSIARKDLLSADDVAGLVLEPPSKARVLVVGPGPAPKEAGAAAGEGDAANAGTTGVDPFLLGALEAMDLQTVRVVDSARYEQIVAAGTTGDGEGLKGWDLVIFDRVRPESLAPVPSISFGRAVPIAGVSVGQVPAREGDGAGHFLSWRRTHPVMRYVGLDQVVVSPQGLVTVPPTALEGAGGSGLEATPLAWGAAGPMIVLLEGGPGEVPTGAAGRGAGAMGGGGAGGRVRRLVVGFELGQSTWGPDFSFPVFLSNAVEFLTVRGSSGAGRAFTTAEPVNVLARPGVRELRVSGPMEARVSVPSADAAGSGGAGKGEVETSLGLLERAGIYRVEGASARDEVLAVNLCDPLESRLLTVQRPMIAGAPVEETTGSQVDEQGRREIWHWFVLAAAALLTIEWFLYAWKMRI